MKQVSREEFYTNVIGNKDAIIGRPIGNYPYITKFKTRDGQLLGECRDRLGVDNEPYCISEYFAIEKV